MTTDRDTTGLLSIGLPILGFLLVIYAGFSGYRSVQLIQSGRPAIAVLDYETPGKGNSSLEHYRFEANGDKFFFSIPNRQSNGMPLNITYLPSNPDVNELASRNHWLKPVISAVLVIAMLIGGLIIFFRNNNFRD